MSIRRCARINIRYDILIFSLLLISHIYASLSSAQPTDGTPAEIPLKIILNSEDKGEFFVFSEGDDFLVKVKDLAGTGIAEPQGDTILVGSEEYISLKSMSGVVFKFDEKNISLEITAEPLLFKKSILTLRYPRRPDVIFTKDNSTFLNYNLTYHPEASSQHKTFTLTSQLGVRMGLMLFLSDFSYEKEPGIEKFTRLMSAMMYDRREKMTRLSLGDFFGASGELGSALNMGGIGFSKNYDIDPYFISYPEIGYSGIVSLPSDVEIYRNGILIKRETLSPGEFELRDITAHTGSGDVKILLKDPFGGEREISLPYYFTDRPLKKGLHEFRYNLGFIREDFDIKSNKYSNPVFLAFHRFGINDSLTPGIRAEAKSKLVNIGFFTTASPSRFGVVDTAFAISSSVERGEGLACSLGYQYQGKQLSFSLLLRGFSRGYSNISNESSLDTTKYEISFGTGYTDRKYGAFSFAYFEEEKYQGTDLKKILGIYSKNLNTSTNLNITIQRDLVSKANEFFVGLQYYFKKGITGSLAQRTEDSRSRQRIQVIKNLPAGKGVGYRAYYERNHTDEDDAANYETALQYNTQYGHYTGEIQSTEAGKKYTFSASGSLTFIKNSFNLSRPVQDSFALVKAGNLKGVRTYLSNQEAGRTNTSGTVLVPDLNSYYDNRISINDKDIPIDYSLAEVVKYVSPPFKGGAYVEFDIRKFQAVTGKLYVKVKDGTKPVEYRNVKLSHNGTITNFLTAEEGEFYLEDIKPGRHKAEFTYSGKDCRFDIIIEESEEILLNLGNITCEME